MVRAVVGAAAAVTASVAAATSMVVAAPIVPAAAAAAAVAATVVPAAVVGAVPSDAEGRTGLSAEVSPENRGGLIDGGHRGVGEAEEG